MEDNRIKDTKGSLVRLFLLLVMHPWKTIREMRRLRSENLELRLELAGERIHTRLLEERRASRKDLP